MSARQTPNEFLKQIIGRPVVVKLNNGVDYRGMIRELFYTQYPNSEIDSKVIHCPTCTGVLACLDGYMNIALEQTEEYSNGQLKNKYGDAFIRGNNVLFISTQKRRN